MTEGPKGVALVTGSKRGLGRAIAFELAAHGFDVAMNDLEPVSVEALDSIHQLGRQALSVPGDVSDLAGHAAMIDQVEGELGPITCLVNNAGIMVPRRSDLLDIDEGSIESLLNVNLKGPLFLSLRAAKRMIASKADHYFRSIVNITSANAQMVSVEKSEYCISKAAMSMASRLLAARLAGEGIHVFELRPGLVKTEMTKEVWERYGPRIDNGLIPFRRWGETNEVGLTVASLASGRLPFCTGTIVNVDGGLHIQQL
jgi:NAD(P)-dependent dehydrogenase (short-subunit alcohol dehydrogenase family)